MATLHFGSSPELTVTPEFTVPAISETPLLSSIVQGIQTSSDPAMQALAKDREFLQQLPRLQSGESLLALGSEGPGVKFIQLRLKELGHYSGPIDGTFGNQTAAAVLAFQKAVGLREDQIVGFVTFNTLAGIDHGLSKEKFTELATRSPELLRNGVDVTPSQQSGAVIEQIYNASSAHKLQRELLAQQLSADTLKLFGTNPPSLLTLIRHPFLFYPGNKASNRLHFFHLPSPLYSEEMELLYRLHLT